MLNSSTTMPSSTDKLSTPSIEEEKLEQGTISAKADAPPESTFTWSNPGPLFKSARRVIIFSLIIWMIFVVLEYGVGIDSYELNWRLHNVDIPASRSYLVPPPKPPKYKICCVEGFRLMLDPRHEPENCGLCLDGPYRTLYEGRVLY
ncbi:unnamed protein product [Rhizoctonia solani]|uniref:Transmembrane protein n=1 Tax=Rhizoctonia solani TaxID=456999 RepID=A0A8H3D7U4_9AGAM|nr:unnamed protein product [Rhizoctonia solani]